MHLLVFNLPDQEPKYIAGPNYNLQQYMTFLSDNNGKDIMQVEPEEKFLIDVYYQHILILSKSTTKVSTKIWPTAIWYPILVMVPYIE